MLTQNIITCALLAGQYAAAAYLPRRDDTVSMHAITITKTVSLTTYAASTSSTTKKPRKTVTRTSTKVVYETPSSADINPINGLPAPTSSSAVNPINGLPVPTVSSKKTKSTSTKTKTRTKTKAKVCSQGSSYTYECKNATAKPSAFTTKTKSAVGVLITPLTKTTIGGKEMYAPVASGA